MDFGKILDQWDADKGKTEKDRKKERLDKLLDKYPPGPEDDSIHEGESAPERRTRLRRMRPQATIDLHGLTTAEAAAALDAFLRESVKKRLEKVLVVHGKGHHSGGQAILKDFVAEFLSTHPLAGENALSERNMGGSGARWVILRQRSR
jgi:DNA-nicking Smr family endonuclease